MSHAEQFTDVCISCIKYTLLHSVKVLEITPMWFCLDSGGGWDSQGWSSSMTSSMQLAQECLKDPPEASEEPPAQLEGLEMFAQTIETGESKLCV